TATPTATATVTPTVSPTPTVTPTATATPTVTPSPTASTTPTVSPTATPTPGGCVLGAGYWKNHEQWPVNQLQLGNRTYNRQELQSILRQPPRGNGLVQLAYQEIAAKLNIANGADGSCVAQTLGAVDVLVGNLVIPPVGNGHLPLTSYVRTLGVYNEGRLCAPQCDLPVPRAPSPRPVAGAVQPLPARGNEGFVVKIVPVLASMTLNPATVTGGANSTGTVTLSAAAPAGGAVVALTSSNNAATVPTSVTVAAGATTATFTVATRTVTVGTVASITSTYAGISKAVGLVVNPLLGSLT